MNPKKRDMRPAVLGLGWFSIGLGLAELLAPRGVARIAGLPPHPAMVRLCGLRELAAGIGLLRAQDPAPWVWARVAGDALDLAALAVGLHPDNPHRGRSAGAFAAVAGVTALDVATARRLSAPAPATPARDYRDRSGFPHPPEVMRGSAHDREPAQPPPRDKNKSPSVGAAGAFPQPG